MIDLNKTECSHQNTALSQEDCEQYLRQLSGWQIENKQLKHTFCFNNFNQTTHFVDFVIGLSKQQDHHPEVTFSYKQCTIEYSTHSVNGLSENDFICAKQIDNFLSTL